MNDARRLTTLLATSVALAAVASPAYAAPLETMRVPEALTAAGPLTPAPVLAADTGIDLDRPAFAGRLFGLDKDTPAPSPDGGKAGTAKAGAPGWDLLGSNTPGDLKPDGDPSDPTGGSGHGTLVSGVLGAVAPNARFLALRTCWDGDQCYQYVQAAAINWAAVKVVSMSWLSGPLEPELRAAITNHPEMLFVGIPSGNGGSFNADGEDPQPCNAGANVLCVSTAADNDGLDCGAFGPSSVDVAVPTRGFTTPKNGGGTTTTGCATSFAAPAAAGVASILYGAKPTASGAELRNAIVMSARKVPAWSGKSVSGGIIDAAAAVQALKTGAAPGPVPVAPAGFMATIARVGRVVRITATEESTVTGLMYRDGKFRKQVNDLPMVGGSVKFTLPREEGQYRFGLTVTSPSGEHVLIDRTFKVKR